MSEGNENQQGQQETGSQGQADGQSAQSAGSGQAAQGANAGQSASATQAGQPAAQTQSGSGGQAAQTGQSAAGTQQSAQGQQAEGAQTQTQTPATQAKGIQVKLTQEQIDRLVKDGNLELSDETFTGAVRDRIAQLTARAKGAERRLAEIAAAQEEAERKALEEQERYKELYEKEHQAREKETAARPVYACPRTITAHCSHWPAARRRTSHPTHGPVQWADSAASSANRPTPTFTRSHPGTSWTPRGQLGRLGRVLEHKSV